MIKSKEEYYSILERLRTLNFNQKLGRNLQAKLEAFEEIEELVNLTIPVVGWRSEQLPDFDVEEINEILKENGLSGEPEWFKEASKDILSLFGVVSTYCECEKYPSRYEESNNYCYDCEKPLN